MTLKRQNDWLAAEIYPDSDDFDNSSIILQNGADGVVDRVEFQYNRLGEVLRKRDQNGTVHRYFRDGLGRLTSDNVETFGSGVDNSVTSIETKYDHAGNVKRITSYRWDYAGFSEVVNQIMYEYDDHGLLHKEYSNPNGAVNVNTSHCITYTYDKSKDENDLFEKGLRPISVTYPSGRIIRYEYGEEDSEADRLNRYTAIKDGNVTLVTYEDEGVSTTAKVTYSQPGLSLDYTASGALDRFGRVTDHAWKKGATNIARIKHGYNRAGNRQYREDTVGAGFSELYGYDGVNQLTDMQRGTLNGTKTSVTNKNFAENFAFDATGNWQSFHQDPEGNGTWPLYQTREHNKSNEIVNLVGTNTYVESDKNGNMTKMPKPDDWSAAYDLKYDVWNRLVQVKDGNAVVATYEYNGLNQRIKKTVGTTVTNSVFNRNWQELESKTGSVTTTYVWGLRYIDDLVCRDRGSERIYAIQDANWNVITLCNTSGAVQERITYDAFGKPTWLSASYGSKTTSGYAWNRTFTGQVYDAETGLMLYRNRFYHSSLGRFVTRDPIGYESGDVNLMRYVGNQATIYSDMQGLAGGGFVDAMWRELCNSYSNTAGNAWLGLTSTACEVGNYAKDVVCVHAEFLDLVHGDGSYRYDECSTIGKNNQPSDPDFIEKSLCNAARSGIASGTCGASELAMACYEYELTGDLDAAQQHCFSVAGMNLASAAVCKGVSPRTGTANVTRWGRPGLQPGDWVMVGNKNPWFYLLSGKWQPGYSNQFAPYGTGRTFQVPGHTLKWPPGAGRWKGVANQRIYDPSLPPPNWDAPYPVGPYWPSFPPYPSPAKPM